MRIRKPYQFVGEEKRASKEYKQAAGYERKYGNPKLADVYDKISKDEARHEKRIARVMKL